MWLKISAYFLMLPSKLKQLSGLNTFLNKTIVCHIFTVVHAFILILIILSLVWPLSGALSYAHLFVGIPAGTVVSLSIFMYAVLRLKVFNFNLILRSINMLLVFYTFVLMAYNTAGNSEEFFSSVATPRAGLYLLFVVFSILRSIHLELWAKEHITNGAPIILFLSVYFLTYLDVIPPAVFHTYLFYLKPYSFVVFLECCYIQPIPFKIILLHCLKYTGG